MLLIPPFHEAPENITEATIELFGIDGAAGTAKGAGFGAGFYGTPGEVLSSLRRIETIDSDATKKEPYENAYVR